MNSLISFIALGVFGSASAFSMTLESAKVQTYDGQSLNAFWSIPDKAPVGVVLLIQGSGNVGADGDVSGAFLGQGYKGQPAKLSENMASALATAGIISLRYDKRGVVDPTQIPNQTVSNLKSDAESALAMIKARYPNLNVGIVGLSEGAFLATQVAAEMPVKSLFLMSLFSRQIDAAFAYQFVGWPTGLLLSHFDPTATGSITGDQLKNAGVTTLPLTGANWMDVDQNKDGILSESSELFPAYQAYYSAVRGLLSTPGFHNWYQSYLPLKPFSEMAADIQSESIFIYQGMDDAQVRWDWVLADSVYFSVKPTLHFYSGLGHCFSPMEGVIGEIKTSGPFADEVLQALVTDVVTGLK